VKNHGTVNHTANGRQASNALRHELLNVGAVCDVARADHDFGADLAELINELLDLASGRAATGHQDNVPGTLADHPPGHAATKTTSTTNKNIGGIVLEDLVEFLGRGCL